MKKFGKLVAVMLTASMLLVGCGNSASTDNTTAGTTAQETGNESKKVISVGTNAEFPPFEFMNDEGKPDGFDIALIEEIGKRAGFEVEIKNMDFDGLMGAMESKGIDMVIAGMTVTDERKESVDFSDSYYHANQVIVVKKDNEEIQKFADLANKKVGVQSGTTGDFMVSPEEEDRVADNIDVKRMNKAAEAIMDLKNGGIEAVVIDKLPAEQFVAVNDDLKILTDDSVEPEDYAIAIQKGDTEMQETVNKALKEIQEDGTFEQLVSQYMGDAK